jgi:hypothetical protein
MPNVTTAGPYKVTVRERASPVEYSIYWPYAEPKEDETVLIPEELAHRKVDLLIQISEEVQYKMGDKFVVIRVEEITKS